MNDNYPIVVFWSDKDNGWIAAMPDLDSLSAHGDSAEEAVHELMVARDTWFAIHRSNGHPSPDPRGSRFWPDIMREQFERQTSSEDFAARTVNVETVGAG